LDNINDYNRRYEMGFVLGLGAKYKKVTFEIRGEGGNGMTKSTGASARTVRYYLLIGYKF